MKLKFVAALLAGSAIIISAPAWAQDPAPQPAQQTDPDPSDTTADAAIQNAQGDDDAQAKIELHLAQATVDYEDIWLAYDVNKTPITLQVGYFYPFSSLETMTSSKYTSFLERTSFHDAFNYNRRLGVAFLANDKKNDRWTFQAGI